MQKKPQRAKLFWNGRSQAVRLPKEFRFTGTTVTIRRKGAQIILEPDNEWPEGWIESFAGKLSDDFSVSRQGPESFERRPKLRR